MNFLTTYKNYIIIAVVVLLLTIIALSGGYIKIQSNEIKSLQKTLVDYATRKVCTAVNDALTEVITPINKALEKLTVICWL